MFILSELGRRICTIPTSEVYRHARRNDDQTGKGDAHHRLRWVCAYSGIVNHDRGMQNLHPRQQNSLAHRRGNASKVDLI